MLNVKLDFELGGMPIQFERVEAIPSEKAGVVCLAAPHWIDSEHRVVAEYEVRAIGVCCCPEQIGMIAASNNRFPGCCMLWREFRINEDHQDTLENIRMVIAPKAVILG